jgi:hypothetical protein
LFLKNGESLPAPFFFRNNSATKTQRILNVDHCDLPFDLAQGGELVEPFAVCVLLFDRPFEVGDRIEVWSAPAGTSTRGDVIDIGCARFHILPTWLKQRLMSRELRSRTQNGIFTLKGRFEN